ncbi:hypothetical protein [Brevibacillus agri]|uniref:hypothetical protein n=1 Tax=Brevibacillus agri TaxID=51101 RepID=UPI002867EFB9|nr:hypothetical protein [Brevibacillus agri]
MLAVKGEASTSGSRTLLTDWACAIFALRHPMNYSKGSETTSKSGLPTKKTASATKGCARARQGRFFPEAGRDELSLGDNQRQQEHCH